MAASLQYYRHLNTSSHLRSPESKILRLSRHQGTIVDTIQQSNETKNPSLGEANNQLTCVMKFGGSSVASAERIRDVAAVILSFPNDRPVIVLSAMGKITNKLLLAGEKAVSCRITNVETMDELGFIKDLHLRSVDKLGVERSIIEGEFCLLFDSVVWKDVDSVLTCDPNINPHAEHVPYLTFGEAAELAYCGAKVLHPLSMRPAREGDIPVKVKNSYNPTAPGTLITRDRDMSKVCNS
ncbi:hypothetical protein SLEP1_g35401 [Rubroshorea leprosula]|uniref:Aspartate/glutamate/uridylate kinase domain-containing protein n=1 Tax=Rubroshorea leprosula TaxID=152421 RepID=A0AAV5KNC7_9ROSI|nr:hypothetical protein SLEP1_g35401 [Rubroshorea leprosula]